MAATDQNKLNLNDDSDEITGAATVTPQASSSSDIEGSVDASTDTNLTADEKGGRAENSGNGSGGDGRNGGNGGDAGHDDEDGDDDGGDDDADTGGTFNAFPPIDGEFLVPLSALGEWEHHPRNGSRTRSDHAAALTRTAVDLSALRPLRVLPAIDGVHPIVDGRFLWCAIKAAHPGNEDVMVRCVLYPGDEAEAVAEVCDAALGMVAASAIERAQALLALKLTNGISQKEMAERYPRLTVSIVSDMLIAARMRKTYPLLFDILAEPDRAPIAYGCAILTLRKKLAPDEFQQIIDRAADLFENGERFKPAAAFDALQVDRPGKGASSTANDATANGSADDDTAETVFGHDDQPVGTADRLTDGTGRLCLPPTAAVTAMTPMEREAAADAFIELIRQHFGLDQQG